MATRARRSGTGVIGGRSGLILLLGVVWAAVFGVTALGSREAMVAAPIAVSVGATALFLLVLLRRSRVVPLDEIGTWYIGIALVYTVLPLIVYLVLGMQYGPINDLRLYLEQPQPEMVATLGWYFTAYLMAFAGMYLLIRGRASIPTTTRPHVSQALGTAAILLWLFLTVGLLIPRLFYNLSADTYIESYAVVSRLPILVRQWIRFTGGIRLVVELVILVWVFDDWKKRRWIAFAWLGYEGSQMLLSAGARTELMMALVAVTVLYHRLRRPVRFPLAVAGSVLILVVFMGLGYWRSYRGLQEVGAVGSTLNAGEFEAVFANAIDIYQRKRAGELNDLPPGLLLSDLVAPIPSQLLPFPKQSIPDWYMSEFYLTLREQGGGLAFGAIPQSLLGYGLVEVILRGAFVGLLFGVMTRWAARRAGRLWVVVFYLWMTLFAYNSLRSTTFHVMSSLVQHFVPAVVVVEVARWAVRRASVRGGSPGPALTPAVVQGPR